MGECGTSICGLGISGGREHFGGAAGGSWRQCEEYGAKRGIPTPPFIAIYLVEGIFVKKNITFEKQVFNQIIAFSKDFSINLFHMFFIIQHKLRTLSYKKSYNQTS